MSYSTSDILSNINFQRYFTGLTVAEFLSVLSNRGYLNTTVTSSEIPSHLRPDGVLTWLWTNYTTHNVDLTSKTKVDTPLNKHPWIIKQEIKQYLAASGTVLISLLSRSRAEELITDQALSNSSDLQNPTKIIYNCESPNSGLYTYIVSNEPFNGTVPLPAWEQPVSVPRTPRSVQNVVNSLNTISPTGYKTITLLNMSVWSDAYNNDIYSDTLGSNISSGVAFPYLGGTINMQVPSGFKISPWANNFMIPAMSGVWKKWLTDLKASGLSSLDLVHIGLEPPSTANEYFVTGNTYYLPASGNQAVSPPSGVSARELIRSDSRYPSFSGLLGFDIPSSFVDLNIGYLPGSGYTNTQVFNEVAYALANNNFNFALFSNLVNSFPEAKLTNFQNHHKCITIPWSQGTNNYNSPWGIGHLVGNDQGLGYSYYGALNRDRGDGTYLYNQVYVDWASGIGSGPMRYKTVGPTNSQDVQWSALLNSLLSVVTAQACSTRTISDFCKFPDEPVVLASGNIFNTQEGTLHKLLAGVKVLQDGNSTSYNSSGNALLFNNIAAEFNSVVSYDKSTVRPIPTSYYGDNETNYEYWRIPFVVTTSDVGGFLLSRVTPRQDKFNTTTVSASGLNGVSGIVVYESTTNRSQWFPRGEIVVPSVVAAPSGFWIKQTNRTGSDYQNWFLAKDSLLDSIFGSTSTNGLIYFNTSRGVNNTGQTIKGYNAKLASDLGNQSHFATGERSLINRTFGTDGQIITSGTVEYSDFNKNSGFVTPTRNNQGPIRVMYPSAQPQKIELGNRTV